MFLDVFSRKIVGWEVHESESPDYSSTLLRKICESEGIEQDQLTVHADNGGPMKGANWAFLVMEKKSPHDASRIFPM
jgi:transposase InsO family protein